MSPGPQTNKWQRISFGSTEHTTNSSCMSLPFSLQLPSVITISLTYERKKYIYRTFFVTTNFQLQIMYSTGAKEAVCRVGLNILFLANHRNRKPRSCQFRVSLPTQIYNASLATALNYKSGFKNIIFGFVCYYIYVFCVTVI
jgi:hypothetical protein